MNNSELKKILDFKILTYQEIVILFYLDLNKVKKLDIKLISAELDMFAHNLQKKIVKLKEKGFLKIEDNILTVTFSPFDFSEKKAKKTKAKKENVEIELEVIDTFFKNQEVNSLFHDFLKNRKMMKVENTDRAINLLLNKLNQYPDTIKIEMLENSILNNWKSVFPPKSNNFNIKKDPQTQANEWLNEMIFEEQQKNK